MDCPQCGCKDHFYVKVIAGRNTIADVPSVSTHIQFPIPLIRYFFPEKGDQQKEPEYCKRLPTKYETIHYEFSPMVSRTEPLPNFQNHMTDSYNAPHIFEKPPTPSTTASPHPFDELTRKKKNTFTKENQSYLLDPPSSDPPTRTFQESQAYQITDSYSAPQLIGSHPFEGKQPQPSPEKKKTDFFPNPNSFRESQRKENDPNRNPPPPEFNQTVPTGSPYIPFSEGGQHFGETQSYGIGEEDLHFEYKRTDIDQLQSNYNPKSIPQDYIHKPSGDIFSIFKEATETTSLFEDHTQKKEFAEFDWTSLFSEYSAHKDPDQKWKLLHELSRDFISCATDIGRIIISEKNRPEEQRTIHPAKLGGFAGGEKYLVRNILFKFARDVQLSQQTFLYGGASPSTEKSMKAAGLELGAIQQIFSLHTDIKVPLMTLIDFQGERLLAVSIIKSISKDSLIYGSADAGNTIRTEDLQFNVWMEKIGLQLNLKKHRVGEVELVGPTDIEGHKVGSDYYLLDLARLFPPESPVVHQNIKTPRCIFYQQFRPEFVQTYHTPLCSDSFSGFSTIGKGEDERQENENNITKATLYLYDTIIPKFAKNLDQDKNVSQIADIMEQIHQSGINYRHLGYIRNHLIGKRPRKLILTEMVARIIKNQVRSIFRKIQSEKKGHGSEQEFAQVIVSILHMVLRIESPLSIPFWCNDVKRQLIETYGENCLDKEELLSDTDLFYAFNSKDFIDRISLLLSFKISNRYYQLIKSSNIEYSGMILPSDINIKPKVKYINYLNLARVKDLSSCVPDNDPSLLYFETELRHCLTSTPNDAQILTELGMTSLRRMRYLFYEQNLMGMNEIKNSILPVLEKAVKVTESLIEFPQAKAQYLFSLWCRGKCAFSVLNAKQGKEDFRLLLEKDPSFLKIIKKDIEDWKHLTVTRALYFFPQIELIAEYEPQWKIGILKLIKVQWQPDGVLNNFFQKISEGLTYSQKLCEWIQKLFRLDFALLEKTLLEKSDSWIKLISHIIKANNKETKTIVEDILRPSLTHMHLFLADLDGLKNCDDFFDWELSPKSLFIRSVLPEKIHPQCSVIAHLKSITIEGTKLNEIAQVLFEQPMVSELNLFDCGLANPTMGERKMNLPPRLEIFKFRGDEKVLLLFFHPQMTKQLFARELQIKTSHSESKIGPLLIFFPNIESISIPSIQSLDIFSSFHSLKHLSLQDVRNLIPISIVLPGITSLEASPASVDLEKFNFHFPNVTTLTLKSVYNDHLKKINLSKITSLSCHNSGHSFTSFFDPSPRLVHLELFGFSKASCEETLNFFRKLNHLKVLRLPRLHATCLPKLIPIIVQNTQLEKFFCNQIEFNDELTEMVVKKCPNLQVLSLQNTSIKHCLFTIVKHCPNLTRLDLNQTLVTEQGIAQLMRLPHLTELDLDLCQITDHTRTLLLSKSSLKVHMPPSSNSSAQLKYALLKREKRN